MCSPNISNLSRRKSPNPCATSRCGPSRARCAWLVVAILSAWGPALAQVERRELPVLQGEPSSSKDSKGTADAPVQISPPLLSPPPPSLARDIGRAPAGSTLPRDLWRGLDAAAMERLLGGLPLPSPSPTLARLIATTLATGATGE